jgi:uncharacterized membrane protein
MTKVKMDVRNIIKKQKEYFQKIYFSQTFIWIIIIIGLLIRLRQYLANRSLWTDEAALVLNILKLNYKELLSPLFNDQAAPPFFLLLTKLFTKIAGCSEFVLRFVPFVSGIIALILFYPLALNFLSKKTVPLAIVIFAFSNSAIYYSTEFKQYSLDLLFSVIILLFAIKVIRSNYTIKDCFILGIIGVLSIWISYSSIFILIGIGLAFIFDIIIINRKKIDRRIINYSNLKKIITIGILWAISFLLHYLLILRFIPKEHFYKYWANYFIPFPPIKFEDFRWYIVNVIEIINNPLGFRLFYGFVLIILILGIYKFWNRENKMYFYFLCFPIITVMVASALNYYPIFERLMLFTIPIFYILFAEGAYQFFEFFSNQKKYFPLLLIILLLIYPVVSGIHHLVTPILKEEIKPIIEYCIKNKEEKDKIYVYYGAKNAFEYYTYNENITFLSSESGNPENPQNYLLELDKLKREGKIWFIFSHVYSDEEKIFLLYLDHIGCRMDSFIGKGASVYLYDL